MWTDVSEWAKQPEDTCVPCECSPKGNSAEEGFNLSCGYQSLSPASPDTAQWAQEQVAMVAGTAVMHGLSNTHFTHQGQPDYCHCCVSSLSAAETNMAPLPRATSQLAAWWQAESMRTLPSWQGSILFLLERTLMTEYRLSLSIHSALAKTTIHGLTECLIHTTVFLIKKLTSQ